ncbi:hypothetical protein N7470_008703 [Penicillium chermesinum]|nr:hypothetical protein N7470_008703 [Penicillium chermesinum]
MPVVLDLARVQGELLKCCKLADRGAKLAHQSNLNDQMVEIFPRLHCPTRTYGSDVFSCEWLAVEFAYHAIMVDIMRSRLKFMFSPMTHRECIAHSRTALKAMLSIQKILANTPGYEDPFPSFLTWTILLYPLSPFFVLFCNVIGEMNVDDYNMIEEILQGLSHFSASPYVSKLYNLLETLQSLSKSLFDAQKRLDPPKKVAPWYPAAMRKSQDSQDDVQGRLPSTGEVISCIPSISDPQQALGFGDGVNASEDELMWHLFTSNLSLDWFDTGLTTSNEACINI